MKLCPRQKLYRGSDSFVHGGARLPQLQFYLNFQVYAARFSKRHVSALLCCLSKDQDGDYLRTIALTTMMRARRMKMMMRFNVQPEYPCSQASYSVPATFESL